MTPGTAYTELPSFDIKILEERQLAIVLNNFVNRFEEAGKPITDTPIHEVTLYTAAKQYLIATR